MNPFDFATGFALGVTTLAIVVTVGAWCGKRCVTPRVTPDATTFADEVEPLPDHKLADWWKRGERPTWDSVDDDDAA